MKIYLFLFDRICNFNLPAMKDGSFSFDPNDEETKLINVEARDNKWFIYSTDGVNVLENNMPVKETEVKDGSYYVLMRDNRNYLIYVTSINNDKFNTFSYQNFSMVIGDNGNCNVIYNNPYLSNYMVKIYSSEGRIILEKTDSAIVYVDRKNLKTPSIYLNNGDEINIYGLKIIILNNLILMNNPNQSVKMNGNFGLTQVTNVPDEMPKNEKIIDHDLYTKDDYFSKAPRIRRIIEEKKIKLSPPPGTGNGIEMPWILTVGTMLAMGMTSGVMLIQSVMQISSGQSTFAQSWPQLLMGVGMLISMLVFPMITNAYKKKQDKKKKAEDSQKYSEYLKTKEAELIEESNLQREIYIENLLTLNQCLDIIKTRGIGFWDRRVDQNDFLTVRIGMGKQPLQVDLSYNEDDFSADDDDLKKQADDLSSRYKYIGNVPASYSFYENKITAIMGTDQRKCFAFTNNVLLQLLTFYSYEDLKIVIFTNEENKDNWEYMKFLNHNFDNSRRFRFFATDQDSAKTVSEYLNMVLQNSSNRRRNNDETPDKPYYLIVIDDYDLVKRFDFMKSLVELKDEDNYQFSVILVENSLNELPSRCNNFISLSNNMSAVLKNSFEKQEQNTFKDEVEYDINMMDIAKIMSNIPIEFEEGTSHLPNSINYLEMMKVGKVEQLNILNRWNMNDSTMSLKAEIGVDNQGDTMYLDLHEKAHGPHGLIAGTTGSGKSEFIITYILSMCINYSPDDIAFILIDYKGGGLALAFENRTTGVVLPHLAGTITNLDKAEMDRTLVSINSETKRRQEMFNKARDTLGESTMDIYKYQKFYKEGRLTEPIPHLFIICDEFAELKAQQPDFMDNLISVARIGRSLGVHLILATQKPSGVVNDQIWSNTRFRVCLKVQDEADSKEMLKKPDAAHISQAGRFYLQVGYDEVYALGQSGYTGAKYYPSDRIVKQVDKSINFINDCGQPIKSIQASTGSKGKAQGEQLQAVMKLIIDTAKKVNKKARRLWLDNIPATIIIDELDKKYEFQKIPYHPEAIIGEYDAPELQKQGKVVFDYLENGNTAVYGNDGSEREMFLSALIYSTCKNYTSDEINFYLIDYGSESLRRYMPLPQIGGMAFIGENDKYVNLLKLLKKEMNDRKEKFVNYGGEYKNFIKNSNEKLPVIACIVNNYDTLKDTIETAYDDFPEMLRDSERYGIVYIITANASNSVQSRLAQNINCNFAFKLKDKYEYMSVFAKKASSMPRDVFGRGYLDDGVLHQFQTASITESDDNLNDFIQEFIKNQKAINKNHAKRIPVLPKNVRYEDIENDISDIYNVPVGISSNDLEVMKWDFVSNLGTIISSNRISNTDIFVKSLLYVLNRVPHTSLLIIDQRQDLKLDLKEYPNYYHDNLDDITDKINDYILKLNESKNDQKVVIFVYNVMRYISKLNDPKKFTNLVNTIKKQENVGIIIDDDYNKLKQSQFSDWYTGAFESTNGIWIGRGILDQSLFRVSNSDKQMRANYKNDMGYVITDGLATLSKMLDFYTKDDEDGE